MELDGTVQNGVIVIDGEAPLPEGARVKIVIPVATSVGERLSNFKGVAQGLPADLAENHDHYLHGKPKR